MHILTHTAVALVFLGPIEGVVLQTGGTNPQPVVGDRVTVTVVNTANAMDLPIRGANLGPSVGDGNAIAQFPGMPTTLQIVQADGLPRPVSVGQVPTVPAGASIEGLVAETGSGPISNARVTLTPQGGGAVIGVDSNSEGRYQFNNLLAGRYSIAVTKSGYFRPRSAFLNITLAGEQQLKNLNLELARTLVIAGRVLDQDQRPVAAATVVALKRGFENGTEYLLPPGVQRDWVPGGGSKPLGFVVESGPDGEYRLFGLEPGKYYVGVWSKLDNGMESFAQPQYFPGVMDPELAIPLSVQPGGALIGMDVHVSKHPQYRIQFKVADAPCEYETSAYGKPRLFSIVRRTAAGLKIPVGKHLVFDRAPILAGLPPNPAATSNPFTPAGESTWISPGLYSGTYEILYTSCFVLQESAAGNVAMLVANITDRDIDSAVMDVRTTVFLRGHVIATSGLSERVNLKGLRVALMDLDDRTTSLLPSGGVFQGIEPLLTGKDGAVDIPHMPAGHYAIGLLSGPTRIPPDVYVASVRIGGREVRETGFYLDGNTESLEIRLEANGATIEGVVQNAKQESATNAQIVLVPPSGQRNNITLFKTASVDQNGRFLIQGIAPGDYQLFAWESVAPGDYQNPDFLRVSESQAVKVHVERGSLNIERVVVIPAN